MGALFYSNETYRETLPIIDASGVSAMPFSNFSGNSWLYDSESGLVQQLNPSLMIKTPLFQAEIDRYIKFWNTEFAPLAVVGYKVRLVLCVSENVFDSWDVEWCQGVYSVDL